MELKILYFVSFFGTEGQVRHGSFPSSLIIRVDRVFVSESDAVRIYSKQRLDAGEG